MIGPIIALLAAGAIASEAPLAWPLGWMVVGVMVASGIVLFRRRSKNPLTASASLAGRSTILLPARGGGVAVLFVLAIASARCVHSAPLIARSSDPAQRNRVIFPIDAMQQPAGDYVYLEPDFYEALHRLSSTSRLNSPSWLVESEALPFFGSLAGTRRGCRGCASIV